MASNPNLNELPATGQLAAEQYGVRAQQYLTEAKAFEIDSQLMAEMAADDLKKIKAYAKDVDEKRKSLTKPLDDVKKGIMDLFRPAVEYLEQAETTLKLGLKKYLDEEERKRRELEEAARKVAREQAARLEAEAKAAAAQGQAEQARALEQQAAMVPATVMVSSPAPKMSGISSTQVWKFVIENEKLIPREYLMVDEAKIRKVVQALKAEANIPGVRVYDERQIGARSA